MKVYIVTHGRDSDFLIDSLWSTKEDAEKRIYALYQNRSDNYSSFSFDEYKRFTPVRCEQWSLDEISLIK